MSCSHLGAVPLGPSSAFLVLRGISPRVEHDQPLLLGSHQQGCGERGTGGALGQHDHSSPRRTSLHLLVVFERYFVTSWNFTLRCETENWYSFRKFPARICLLLVVKMHLGLKGPLLQHSYRALAQRSCIWKLPSSFGSLQIRRILVDPIGLLRGQKKKTCQRVHSTHVLFRSRLSLPVVAFLHFPLYTVIEPDQTPIQITEVQRRSALFLAVVAFLYFPLYTVIEPDQTPTQMTGAELCCGLYSSEFELIASLLFQQAR